MASMAAGYGLLGRLREAAIVLACLFFTNPTAAAPPRLLVLGDSLAAGFGLAQADGFQAQLSAALRANGYDITFMDGAVSGDTTAGGRARRDPRVRTLARMSPRIATDNIPAARHGLPGRW